MHRIWNDLWVNVISGMPSNLAASAVCVVAAAVWGRKKLLKMWRFHVKPRLDAHDEHVERTRQIHEHLGLHNRDTSPGGPDGRT